MRVLKKFEIVDLNIFVNVSNLVYCVVFIVVVEYSLVFLIFNVKDFCVRNYYSMIIYNI